MSNFKLFYLKDIAESQTGPFGSQLHQSDYVSEGTPMVTVEHLGVERFTHQNLPFVSDKDRDRLSKYILREGDIVFSRVGSVDRCTYVTKEEDGWMFSGRCIRVRTNENANGRYLNFYFRQDKFKKMMLDISVGATMPSLNTKLMDNIPLRLPNIKTQQKIAKILSDLDAKIELNNKINDNLEQMAKTLYDYWFVQFDFPDANGKPYKTSGGKMVWNEELKREIPEGWDDGTFGNYCKSTGGFAFKSSWWADKGLKVVKIKDIEEDNTINLNNLSSANISNDKIDDKFMAKPGNVLIAMTGATVGKFAIIPITSEPLYVNQRVGYFNLGKEPIKRLPFLINSLNQDYFREAIFTLASGAAQPNISNEQINEIQLLIPSKELIEKFNQMLSHNYSKILINQKENQELASLRDWLLPMLMNGQVTVGAVEEQLGMVAESGEEYKK